MLATKKREEDSRKTKATQQRLAETEVEKEEKIGFNP
jgi:hypothetical protein